MKKRLIYLLLAIAVISAVLLWTWPRGMEQLSNIPAKEVFLAQLEPQFDEQPGTKQSFEEAPGLVAELYAFRFSRPLPQDSLNFHCNGYNLFLCIEEAPGNVRREMFVLLEDGTLWDGTWSYRLAGSEDDRKALKLWIETVLKIPAS